MNYVWVVEKLYGEGGRKEKWRPCDVCRTTKYNAETEIARWLNISPDDKLRLRKYVAQEDKP